MDGHIRFRKPGPEGPDIFLLASLIQIVKTPIHENLRRFHRKLRKQQSRREAFRTHLRVLLEIQKRDCRDAPCIHRTLEPTREKQHIVRILRHRKPGMHLVKVSFDETCTLLVRQKIRHDCCLSS